MFVQEISTIANYQLLPPECQKAREIEAIKNDPRLVEYIGNQIIRDVRPVEGGYLVVTDLCEMKVDVKYLPPSRPIIGEPARFELHFNEPTLINDGSSLQIES